VAVQLAPAGALPELTNVRTSYLYYGGAAGVGLSASWVDLFNNSVSLPGRALDGVVGCLSGHEHTRRHISGAVEQMIVGW
jgi:hypothetical protein